jgi:hypothetical protein
MDKTRPSGGRNPRSTRGEGTNIMPIINKIIDLMTAGVGGRLIVFKPQNGPAGVDLAAERKGQYKEEPVYFMLNPPEFSEDFKPAKNLYLIFVDFDVVTQKLASRLRFVPSADFKNAGDEKYFINSDELSKTVLQIFERR